MITIRDHFDDNVFDVESIEDVLNINSINLLCKKDEKTLFEIGNDFFKLENSKLLQYPDFISMRDDKNSKDCTYTDYGLGISDAITKSDEIASLNNYTLKDRENYIKNNLDGGYVTMPFKLDPNVQKTAEQLKKMIPQSKELSDVTAMTNALIDVVSLMCSFYKAIKIKNSKSKVVNDICDKLNQGDSKSIIRDPKLIKEVPELKEILEKYDKFSQGISINKDFSDFKNKMATVQELASSALGDKDLLNVCEKISESEFFQKNVENAKNKISEIYSALDNILPDIKQNLIDNKEESIESLQNLHKGDFVKFFVEDLGLDAKKNEDNLNFLLANNYFSRELLGDTSEDYDYSIMRFISDSSDLDNIQIDKVQNLVEKMSENILDFTVEETQSRKMKF